MGPLTEQSLKTLRATFDQYGHQPSVAMWCGIRSMVEHLERMANGTLAPIAYLSSLDPGVGKTEAVIHFVRALTASRRDVGVLICVSHLKEIASLADRMGLAKSDFAVYTTDDATNALGSDDVNSAQVLFLTQQMVSSRLSGGRRFGELTLFHFQGKPRQVQDLG